MKENQEPRVFVFIGKQDVYTVKQVALKLELSERTISEALRTGKIKGYKQFKKWYVTHDQLLEFLASNQEKLQAKSRRPNANPKQ